jgi:hypothetical protein
LAAQRDANVGLDPARFKPPRLYRDLEDVGHDERSLAHMIVAGVELGQLAARPCLRAAMSAPIDRVVPTSRPSACILLS